MEKLIILFFLVIILMIPVTGNAVVVTTSVSKPGISNDYNVNDLIKLDKKELKKKIGRKLKWKEKIALKFIKAKTKKRIKDQQKTDGFAIAGLLASIGGFIGLIVFSGSLAFAFGLGIGVLAIIFSIIGLNRIRRNPESKKGKILAIIGLFVGSTLLLISTLGAIGYLI